MREPIMNIEDFANSNICTQLYVIVTSCTIAPTNNATTKSWLFGSFILTLGTGGESKGFRLGPFENPGCGIHRKDRNCKTPVPPRRSIPP